MAKVLQFRAKGKSGKVENKGFLEVKNQSETSVDLYIYGDIVSDDWYKYTDDDKCPKDIADFLSSLSNVENINLHINSGGGSAFGGIAIYNQLKRYKATITAYIDGLAASIASVIAFAGDKIIIPSNAEIMIHKPMTCYFQSMLNADKLRKDADKLDVIQKSIINTYMNKVREGVTEEQINDFVNSEKWFTAEEAAQIFDIEIEESLQAVACSSDLYDKYINAPDKYKEDSNNITVAVDIEQLASAIVDKLNIDKFSIDDAEKIKDQLIEDLWQYGT